MTAIRNVVLVHGGFVDGSGWQGVYDDLARDGFRIRIVQNPTLSLEGDVAATRRVLDALDGPAVLVGHSYGGVVISEAGSHPNVAALAYIAAFAPDKGESVNTLIADPPPGAPVPPILPPHDGLLYLDRDRFHNAFAADLPAQVAAFMADAQVPWGVDALGGAVTEPAWRHRPSWYLVATEDRMIPPPAQRAMAERAGAFVVEAIGSHAVYVSQPAAVAGLIRQAAA
ncbi:alpha/beta fold hydrolase [Streptosporangium sp. 'caverna']|uniref:alpha/beta fold hydrolase n=1 Tax=Streptosporangium sp. 'caverna' TaxID=2202249 RepID=UPI000D7D5C0D|nr:alpha/beta hydrolase [Streptosporangium sp. 'caverna']AWS47359.1 alpha/beta hydrolase [Streptosporangium sp. 'caverna']